jgi:polyisoprenoid-binding protein YceI
MPVAKADLIIDPENLTAAQIAVTLDVTATRTGFIFATEALKGRSVLNAAQFPTVTFTSTSIKLGPSGRLSNGATVTGRVTLRGVTKPITLRANIYRPRGSPKDDLSRLDVRLTGRISRNAFGATGYADLVNDAVLLDIRAKIRSIP